MTAKVFFDRPQTFTPTLEVAACYCIYDNQTLLLQRHSDKLEGGKWCMPGGKRDKEEDLIKTAQRELFEETGIDAPLGELKPVKQFFIEKPSYTFSFQVYHIRFATLPMLFFKEGEIVDGAWLTHDEALKKPLVMGGYEVLKYCQNMLQL